LAWKIEITYNMLSGTLNPIQLVLVHQTYLLFSRPY